MLITVTHEASLPNTISYRNDNLKGSPYLFKIQLTLPPCEAREAKPVLQEVLACLCCGWSVRGGTRAHGADSRGSMLSLSVETPLASDFGVCPVLNERLFLSFIETMASSRGRLHLRVKGYPLALLRTASSRHS